MFKLQQMRCTPFIVPLGLISTIVCIYFKKKLLSKLVGVCMLRTAPSDPHQVLNVFSQVSTVGTSVITGDQKLVFDSSACPLRPCLSLMPTLPCVCLQTKCDRGRVQQAEPSQRRGRGESSLCQISFTPPHKTTQSPNPPHPTPPHPT